MKSKEFILPVALLFVGLVAGFFGGKIFQQKTPRQNSMREINGTPGQVGQNIRTGNSGNTARAGGYRPVNGEVTALDDKSLTVKMSDGSSRIVLLSDKTTYVKTDTAAKTDLKVGSVVSIFSSDNSDGSVTAQNIQLNPQQMKFAGSNQ